MDRQGKKTLATEARHPVWIQAATSTPDGEGGFTLAWANIQQVFASINPIQARQQFQFRTINVEATHLIRIRGYVEISEKNRILFGAREFEVLTVENTQERDIEQVITCKERRE